MQMAGGVGYRRVLRPAGRIRKDSSMDTEVLCVYLGTGTAYMLHPARDTCYCIETASHVLYPY